MKKNIAVLFLFSLGLLVVSCGGGGGGTDGGQVRVAVSPSTVNVIAGQTQQFTATVTGALNSAVAWTVSCATSTCGTISSAGLYTSPALIPADTTVTVRATSQEDTNIVGTATVTQSAVAVAVSPSTNLTLISADTRQFTATVDDAPTGHGTVTWSVSGGGTIDANGLYSAPAKVTADATVTVTATSDFDNTKHTSATVTLKAPAVTLSPGDMRLEGGGQQQFVPTVLYVPAGQNGVTWTLDGLGTISAGLYNAPMLIGTHQGAIIRAISVFDNTKSAQVVVTMDPIVIGVTPEVVTKYPEETHQFTASVVNHVNKAVTWSVTGTSCGGGACGEVDANGLYTAPSSIASEFTVNVVATSVADNSKTDIAAITLKPITVTVSPKTASVKVTTTQQFSASVQGGTNTNVTWSVSGTGCTGNTCGTISSAGLYTAPATVPNPATVTIRAAAVADPTRFDTAIVTLIYDPNVKLNGMYAFTFTGWDASGRPMDAIGSMVADGNGHLTGLIDMNGMTYANHNYFSIKKALTGTYQVNAGDNRGEMVFTFTSSVVTESFNFRFAIDATGSRGHFLLFEAGTGRYGSGIFKRQIAADFSLSNLNGGYALGMAGLSVYGDERNGILARAHLDGSGGVSDTSLDIVNTDGPAGHYSFTGSVAMSAATGANSGRGTLTLSAVGQTLNFSFYMVDASETFVLVSDQFSDSVPPLMGKMLKQTKQTFTSADFSGRIVMYMTGINPPTLPNSSVFIGAADLSTGMGTYEFNYGGTQIGGADMIVTSTVASNGRTVLGLGFRGSWIAYLVAPNTGFIMQYDDPGTMVLSGFFEQQSDPPFTLATLNGEYFGGAVDAGMSAVGYGNGLQNWNGNGAWSGTGNVADPSSGLYPDIPVSGTYTITDSSLGAGNWLGDGYHKKFYVVSPNKIVFVPTELSNIYPALEIFEK